MASVCGLKMNDRKQKTDSVFSYHISSQTNDEIWFRVSSGNTFLKGKNDCEATWLRNLSAVKCGKTTTVVAARWLLREEKKKEQEREVTITKSPTVRALCVSPHCVVV